MFSVMHRNFSLSLRTKINTTERFRCQELTSFLMKLQMLTKQQNNNMVHRSVQKVMCLKLFQHPSLRLSLGRLSKFHYLFCYWRTCCCSHKVSITPPLCWTVHPFTGRCGAGLSGPGPAVPALLFHLPVLPAEQKRGAAQRRLLLHGLVCHYRNACLQVSTNTGSAAAFSSCIINVWRFALTEPADKCTEERQGWADLKCFVVSTVQKEELQEGQVLVWNSLSLCKCFIITICERVKKLHSCGHDNMQLS